MYLHPIVYDCTYISIPINSILLLYSLKRCRLTGIGIPIINLRRSDDRLRFLMEIPIPIRWWVSSLWHYSDVIMGTMASQITSLGIAYSTIYSGADHRRHQSSASLAFVRGIHRWPVNSPHKGPVARKMFPFDDVIIIEALVLQISVSKGSPTEVL